MTDICATDLGFIKLISFRRDRNVQYEIVPGKTIEKFYVWLRKQCSQNSCRALVNTIIQYCKYNNIEPRIKKSLHIYKTTVTTRDHMLTVDEARSMYEIGSLEEKILIKAWLLGLRIGDACRLQWNQFDITPSDEPKEILVNTKKEEVVAHCFIDPEFQHSSACMRVS